MPKQFLVLLVFGLISLNGISQQRWNLRSVVEYAMANNLGVKQAEVQAKISDVNLKQSERSRLPFLNFSGGASLNSGSNQDPTTFSRITQSYLANNMQLQSSVDIFNFYSRKNSILASEWESKASHANVEKLKNDIALTAANAYLQVLLAREQQNITLVQVQQTTAQLTNTRKLVDAGALPPLNATQLEAQLALDSVNFFTAKGNYEQAVLLLKSYMNIDAATPFEVEAPPVESIPVEPIADLQPEYVYQLALQNQPLQKVNSHRLKAAGYNISSARGAMYPTISAFGSLGTAFNNQAMSITGSSIVNAPVGNVTIGGNTYDVFPLQPYVLPQYAKTPYFTQLTDNFRQSIGLSISVPILNGGSLRGNYERSKLNYNTLELQQQLDDQNLKQDIYQAYTSAVTALEKFNAARKNVAVNEEAFSLATKRFDVGMLSTFDLITTQNSLLRARLDYLISRFDYVFKMKVLEFYKGQGLTL